MSFGDNGYRLLGLFRLWNAMKYYYPHVGILDVEWNGLLDDFIPEMLAGADRLSYELTLAALAHHLRDSAHLNFTGNFFADNFGRYMVPVRLISVENRLVVYDVIGFGAGFGNPLIRGDVILGLGGRGIDEITAEMLRFLPYPNEEKALPFLARHWAWTLGGHHPLRSHSRDMEIVILRGDIEMTLAVSGVYTTANFAVYMSRPYVLLDNNIGLINPGMQSPGSVRMAMEAFVDTDGIIIDLRQYPSCFEFFLEMRQFLMEEPLPFALISVPSQAHPGMREDLPPINQYLPPSPYGFIYERPVVLLMDEQTISHPEWVIMSLRVAENVTVMGPFSMGSNGNVTVLPLPGDILMSFTGLGVYTLDGEQTHFVGLTPDIRVDRTIQGIREGRDELVEAAIYNIRISD